MERTIIYVFTPKRLQEEYFNGVQFKECTTEWLKIGMTSTSNDNEDKWDAAFTRINQEVRTGISEPCVLVDVFEYPKLNGKPDNVIRNLMTNNVFELQDSKQHNKSVDQQKYEIKAGQEYIYGASKKQVWAAIAVFERNLLIENQGANNFKDFIECITKNNETAIEDQENNMTIKIDNKDIKIYDEIVNDLSNNQIKAIHPSNKNYGYIQSKGKISCYSFSFSRKHNQAIIAVETIGGVSDMQEIEEYITNNNIRQNIALNAPEQGMKKQDKYSWKLIKQYENYDEVNIKNWFVENIIKIYNTFNQNL